MTEPSFLNQINYFHTIMLQVDFYILQSQNLQERERIACKLAEKAWQQSYRVFIYAESSTHAQQIDNLLWTFRQDSFVPHQIYGDSVQPAMPIYIGYDTNIAQGMTALINLTDTVPEFFVQYQRVAEIVANVEVAILAGRERYRFYRDRQVALKTHQI
ncbi:MAG: DNA polymerase III subunit chi [Thiotrichaceae bacterium]